MSMRRETKLGAALALVIGLIATGYYFARDRESEPVSLTGKTVDTGKADADSMKHSRSGNLGNNHVRPRSSRSMTPSSTNPDHLRPAMPKAKDTRVADSTPRHDAGLRPWRVDRSSDRGDPSSLTELKRGSDRITGQDSTPTQMENSPVGNDVGQGATLPRDEAAATVQPGLKPASASNPGPKPGTATDDSELNSSSTTPGRTSESVRPRSGMPKALVTTQPKPASASEVAIERHIVQEGDSFAVLARIYYGSEKHTQYLINANSHIGDARSLRPGMAVNIPEAPSEDTVIRGDAFPRTRPDSAPGKKEANTGASGLRTYTVKKGDSFYAIARDVLGDPGLTWDLLELNSTVVDGEPKNLKPGMILRLPEPKPKKTAESKSVD